MELVYEVLAYALPSGFVGSVVTWLLNRQRLKVSVRKEEHDAFKHMYDDLKDEVYELRKEYGQLQAAYNRLQMQYNRLYRIIGNIARCDFYDSCPVRGELSKFDAQYREKGFRQPANCDGDQDDVCAGAASSGDAAFAGGDVEPDAGRDGGADVERTGIRIGKSVKRHSRRSSRL